MNSVLKNIICCVAVIIMTTAAAAQEKGERLLVRPMLNVGTNVIYDFCMAPSLQIEAPLPGRFSFAAATTYRWMHDWPWHEQIRIGAAEAEIRYWVPTGRKWRAGNEVFGRRVKRRADVMRRGLHVGLYAAIYRYDFYFDPKGEQAEINGGAGLALGWTFPVDAHFSIDVSLAAGYIWGKYRKYEFYDDIYQHFVWQGDYQRSYFGPTRVGVSLIWNIGGTRRQKGGLQ